MELPEMTTIQGAYDYLMGLLVALAIMLAAYLLLVYVGAAPYPSNLLYVAVG